jgi:hypothetical protein
MAALRVTPQSTVLVLDVFAALLAAVLPLILHAFAMLLAAVLLAALLPLTLHAFAMLLAAVLLAALLPLTLLQVVTSSQSAFWTL